MSARVLFRRREQNDIWAELVRTTFAVFWVDTRARLVSWLFQTLTMRLFMSEKLFLLGAWSSDKRDIRTLSRFQEFQESCKLVCEQARSRSHYEYLIAYQEITAEGVAFLALRTRMCIINSTQSRICLVRNVPLVSSCTLLSRNACPCSIRCSKHILQWGIASPTSFSVQV